MRPDQCGTSGLPAGHPDREVVANFALFLREENALDKDDPVAFAAFVERWRDYMNGDCPGPTVVESPSEPASELEPATDDPSPVGDRPGRDEGDSHG